MLEAMCGALEIPPMNRREPAVTGTGDPADRGRVVRCPSSEVPQALESGEPYQAKVSVHTSQDFVQMREVGNLHGETGFP